MNEHEERESILEIIRERRDEFLVSAKMPNNPYQRARCQRVIVKVLTDLISRIEEQGGLGD